MPIVPLRSKQGTPSTPTPAAQEASAPPSQFQGLRNALGMGVRLGGGFLSNAGSWPGALIGGGSELLAEAVEGSLDRTSLGRIAAEAVIGAVPLGKTIKAGRTLKTAGLSAAKSGAFNLAGDVGRQVAEQYDPVAGHGVMDTDVDWGRAGFATAMGTGVGAVLGPLSPVDAIGVKTTPPAPKGPEVVANSGERLRRANSVRTGGTVAGSTQPPYNVSSAQPIPLGGTRTNSRVPYGGDTVDSRQAHAPVVEDPRQKSIQRNYERDFDAAQQENRVRELSRVLGIDLSPLQRAGTVTEGTLASAQKTAQEADEFENLRGLFGDEVTKGSLTKRGRQGTETATVTYGLADDATTTASGGRTAGARGVGVEMDPQIEEIIAKGMTFPEGSQNRTMAEWLANGASLEEAMDNTAKGIRPAPPDYVQNVMAGSHDANVLAARARRGPAGSLPSRPAPRMPKGIPDAYDTEKVMAQGRPGPVGSNADPDLAAAQGRRGPLGEGPDYDEIVNAERPGPLGSNPPKFPTTPGADPETEGLQSLMDYLDIDAAYGRAMDTGDIEAAKALGPIFGRTQARMKELNEVPSGLPQLSSNKGLGVTELIITAGLGLGGGTLGAAIDASQGGDSTMDGFAVGAGLGVGGMFVPKLLESVNLSPETLQTPEGVKEAAKKIFDAIPQFQRFAYLSDFRGAPANIVTGPFGSMITSALEAGLSGDPRGWEVLRNNWNPVAFIRKFGDKELWMEANEQLRRGEIGRAEGLGPLDINNMSSAGQKWNTGMAAPGLAMTVGDLAARRALLDAGFSLDEARTMTLTSEPASDFAQWALRGKRSTLSDILFPFKRTPLNIMEQGGQRMGGSALSKLFGDSTKSWQEVGVQTGLGAGAAVGGYQLGQELDDPRSTGQNMLRRQASNFAGRYSLPVSLGVIAGQTIGQDKYLNRRDIERAMETAIPLPGIDALVDTGAYVAGKAGLTANQNPRLPRNLIPFGLRSEDEPQMLGNLASLRLR